MLSKLALKMYSERLLQIDVEIKKAGRARDKPSLFLLNAEKKRIKLNLGGMY